MRAIVLEYHDIVAGDFADTGFLGGAADSYKLSASDFAAHLAAIAELPAPPSAGGDVHTLATTASRRPLFFTFDDGGAGACTAADLLERHGWIGHFLVTTAQIGRPGFLTGAQLRDLHRRGHVVGSHSHSHPVRMARLSHEQVRVEWQTSTTHLRDILGHPVDVASVPGGYYGRFIAAAAASAGITWLFTSEPTTGADIVDECHVLGRYTLRRATSSTSVRRLAGRSPVARTAQWASWNTKKLAKVVAGGAYLRLRAALFREAAITDSVNR